MATAPQAQASQQTQPKILTAEITDIYLRRNFQNLTDFFGSQNQLLNFKFFELVFTAATKNYTAAHGLGTAPKDVIVTAVVGAGAVTFNHGLADNTNMNLTVTGACRIRFFIGTYWNFLGSATPTQTDSTTYYSSVSTTAATTTTVANLIPNYISFASSGTYFCSYYFTITSGSATAGATYTNNGKTFTVTRTVSQGTLLFCKSNGAPTATGVLTRASGTGDIALTFSVATPPSYITVECMGGGGGGGGAGTSTSAGAGGTGTATTFSSGSTLVSGGAGVGGQTILVGGAGAGGSATLGSSVVGTTVGGGGGGLASGGNVLCQGCGGNGGTGVLGGGGSGGSNFAGNDGRGRGGGGGGGGLVSAASNQSPGNGGGSGGYATGIIYNPATLFPTGAAVVIGTGGSAGTLGTSGSAGGAGAVGFAIVREYWQ